MRSILQKQSNYKRTILIFLVSSGFFFWAAGLFAFLKNIPKNIEYPLRHTDTIVVLTGGSLRLKTGLNLLHHRLAKKLFVSGVHRGVDVEQLLRLARSSPLEAECCISLGHQADDTKGNATETANWMNQQGFRSMRLVTAAYHMPRSIIEFRHVMPHIHIIAHPVFPETVKISKWWNYPGTTGLILGEYSKFLIARLRHILINLKDREAL